MGIIRIYKIVDPNDEDNHFYLIVRAYVDDIIEEFKTGILDREQLLNKLSQNDIPYDITYPEDFEVIEG